MSYRYYLLKADKQDVERIRHMHFKDLIEKYKKNSSELVLIMLNILEKELGSELYQFGSEVDGELLGEIKKEDFFKEKETKENFEQYEVMVLNKDAFKYIAEYFEEKTKRRMELLLTKPDVEDGYEFLPSEPNPIKDVEEILKNEFMLRRIIKEQVEKQQMWTKKTVLNKEKKEKLLSNSWLYEYAVFDMIKFYKEADFEKYYYIMYGY